MACRKLTLRYSRLEDLPNELFYQITTYLTAIDTYNAFNNLNSRFDVLLMSINNLHFEVRGYIDTQCLITASFASRITSISVPEDSESRAIANVFSNVRSITFHRTIRLPSSKFLNVKQIKLDLSNMRPKQAIGLCRLVFSTEFPCLSTLYIFHSKSRVIGHWSPLIGSIKNQSATITQFIFDMRPTFEWRMLTHFLCYMPHLKRLTIRKLNTRTRWTLANLAETLKTKVPELIYLFMSINSLGISTVMQNNEYNRSLHPLFQYIISKTRKSHKLYSTTIISSIECQEDYF